MFPAMSTRSALALTIAAAAAISLAVQGPASARVQSRVQAYTEGFWKEPAKPSPTVELPASVRGGVRTEPPHGSVGRPRVILPMSR